MIDLTKAVMPCAVTVRGRTYRIKTHHYYWVRFSELIREKDVTLDAFDWLYEGEEVARGFAAGKVPDDRQAGLDELLKFFAPHEPLPNVDGEDERARTFDFAADGSMIYAAFMQCYGIDLVDTPLHWHKFLALFNNIIGTRFNDIVGYRLYERSDEEHADAMERLRLAWELPQEHGGSLDRFNAQFD
ncbi:MAG: hypothetical protein J6N15_00210 [Ruminiclostridium sp.]|nr:hypothetical protein [Ruminiclostridium sp.]